ncbi:MAG: hypothetical protein V9F03_04040 [Microthrixaceae bacterium]
MITESQRLDILHAIRLRGLVEVAELARLVGLPQQIITAQIQLEAGRGLLIRHSGRLSGWALSPAGRAEGETLLGVELDRDGDRATVEMSYREFIGMNSEVLSICSDWQIRMVDGATMVNDHNDVDHDTAVLARLVDFHERAVDMLERLVSGSARFDGYPRRLSLARGRIIEGETEWLTRSTIDSYHTIWFELHENLLATLGRSRTEEYNQRSR